VYTTLVKNITLSADERLIEAARERARAERTTLNEEFRKWLEDYVGREQRFARAMAAIEAIQKYASTGGRKFTRDEMNER
jgi:hypothetical protein